MVVKDGSRVLLTLASLVVIGAGLQLVRPLLAPILFAAFVASITAPFVRWLLDRGLPAAVAVSAGLLLDFLGLAGVGVVLGDAFLELSSRQEHYAIRLVVLLDNVSAWGDLYGVDLHPGSLRAALSPDSLMDAAAMVLQRLMGIVSQLFLLLLLVAFMLAELTDWSAKVRYLLRDREDLAALQVAGQDVRGFLRVKFTTSAVTGVLAFLLCAVLRVDLAVLWGLMAFLLNFIPNVGSIIAAIPPIVFALLLHGPATAALVAGGYLAVNMVIGSIIEPRIMGRTLGLSPLVVFVGMLLWGWLPRTGRGAPLAAAHDLLEDLARAHPGSALGCGPPRSVEPGARPLAAVRRDGRLGRTARSVEPLSSARGTCGTRRGASRGRRRALRPLRRSHTRGGWPPPRRAAGPPCRRPPG